MEEKPKVRNIVFEYEDHIWQLKDEYAQDWVNRINELVINTQLRTGDSIFKDFPFDKAVITKLDQTQNERMSIGKNGWSGQAGCSPRPVVVTEDEHKGHGDLTGSIHKSKTTKYL